MHIAIIWTKFLPYHIARIRHLRKRLAEHGHTLTAIEVASKDALYPFPEEAGSQEENYICVFSGASYRKLPPLTINTRIFNALRTVDPDVLIGPATPFPSGMAAIRYALCYHRFSIMMDDAWEYSDRRGMIIRTTKRLLHSNVDVAFIPAPSHAKYYQQMAFPADRIVYGVDVVDNDFFADGAENAHRNAAEIRRELHLPENYFLFVGRLIERKGVRMLLTAYRKYSSAMGKSAWDLVVIGDRDEEQESESIVRDHPGVHFAGGKFGSELSQYYGLAKAFILPSTTETWGLVANEALASGLPILVSSGCGCAKTLVETGKNGWVFPPGDDMQLADRLTAMTSLSSEEWYAMSNRSKEIIAHWSLDTFAESVLKAIQMPRRPRDNYLANVMTYLWRGRISFYP
jgi:glycosyltransferase involved in cell wall biosynthesis